MNKKNILEVQHLSKSFVEGNTRTDVLKEIHFHLHEGEKVAIVGASGSGKSTLLQLLGGLDAPSSGDIIWLGQAFKNHSTEEITQVREQYLGFVYQFHHLLPEFTALENVMLALALRKIPLQEALQQATIMLERVGLSHRLSHRPGELSGGERQRVAIARALVKKPLCVLADEPTGNLDHKTAAHAWALLLELNQDLGTSLLVVTHDAQLSKHMDRVLTMEDGHLRS